MKKTLVALAALAATGAFAQVTMTGEFAYVFQQSTNGTGAQKSGQSVDTSEIYWDAKEDLGGGYKVAAHLEILGADRSGEAGNGAVQGRDGYMEFTTPVGGVKMGAIKNADYLSTYAGLGGTWEGLDGAMQDARTTRVQTTFFTKLSDVTLALSIQGQDQRTAGVAGYGAGYTGTPVGAGQPVNAAVVNYAAGPIVVDGEYLWFNNQAANADLLAPSGLAAMDRLSGNYDFGVVKVGLGWTKLTGVGSGTWTNTMEGVQVPLGATTLLANIQQSQMSGSTLGAGGTRTGYQLEAKYNFSKQTYAILDYQNWLGGIAVPDAQNSNATSLLLVKDF